MAPAPLHTLTRRLDQSDWDRWGKWVVIVVAALIGIAIIEQILRRCGCLPKRAPRPAFVPQNNVNYYQSNQPLPGHPGSPEWYHEEEMRRQQQQQQNNNF